MCVSVSLSVGLLVTFVNPAKTAESIEMPFGNDLGWSKEPLLDGVQIPQGKEHFWRFSGRLKSMGRVSVVHELCQNG